MPAAFLLGGLPLAVGAFLAVAVCFIGTGSAVSWLAAPRDCTPTLAAALNIAFGFVGTFLIILAAGYLHALVPALLIGLAAIGVVSAMACRRSILWSIAAARPKVPDFSTSAFAVLIGVVILAIAVSAVYAPAQPDEVAYHWATPLFWAYHHHWLRSPNISSNGPSFMETIYTAAATVGSSTAAHWIQETFLVLIGCSAAALGEKLCVPRLMSFATAVSVPVFVRQSPLAYSDLAHGGFLLTAVAVVTCCRMTHRTLISASILIAAAGSVKIFAFAEAAFVIPMLLVQLHAAGHLSARRSIATVAAMAAIPSMTLAYWTLRTEAFTGQLFDRSGARLVRSAIDPTLDHGHAAGRIPTLPDLAKLPFVPLITGLIGQREPYGGRSGLVLLVMLPVAIVVLVRRRARGDLVPAVLLLSAYVGYDVVAIVLVKTRFNAWVWPTLTVAALAIAFREAAPRTRLRLSYLVLALSVLQAADGVRVILKRPLVNDQVFTAVTASTLHGPLSPVQLENAAKPPAVEAGRVDTELGPVRWNAVAGFDA